MGPQAKLGRTCDSEDVERGKGVLGRRPNQGGDVIVGKGERSVNP